MPRVTSSNNILTLRRSTRSPHIAGKAWIPAPRGRESQWEGACAPRRLEIAEWASPGDAHSPLLPGGGLRNRAIVRTGVDDRLEVLELTANAAADLIA